MSRRTQSRPGTSAERPLARLGARSRQAGRLLAAAGLPLALAALLVLVVRTGDPGSGLGIAGRALSGPLEADGGVPWLFHVGALAALAGAWLAGLGLVLEGLFG